MTSGEPEIKVEVSAGQEPDDEEPSDSVMVTVSIIGPDGTSWHGSGHLMTDEPPSAEQVVHLLMRAAQGACLAHADDTWLVLRRMWTRYPSV